MDWFSKASIILLAFAVFSCNTKVEKFSEREKQLIHTAQEYVDAFNKHDAEKLGEFFSNDAVYYYPESGDTIVGREAIVQMFKSLFKEDAPKLELYFNDYDYRNTDKVIEKGTGTLTFPDNSQQKILYVVQTRQEGDKWPILSISEVNIEAAPKQSPHLQELGWFIGKWNDTSDDFDIVNDVYWDNNKQFINQRFTVNVLGHDQLNGTQIIGWDPAQQKIRSWLFDSDGGIGEGVWRQVDGSWFVDMTYTLSDGRKASSLHTYKKESDTQYTFTSINRDIDGDVLPDVGPVTFVKVR